MNTADFAAIVPEWLVPELEGQIQLGRIAWGTNDIALTAWVDADKGEARVIARKRIDVVTVFTEVLGGHPELLARVSRTPRLMFVPVVVFNTGRYAFFEYPLSSADGCLS